MGLTPIIFAQDKIVNALVFLGFAGQCFPDIEVIFIVPDNFIRDSHVFWFSLNPARRYIPSSPPPR
jgi:hypothetical protein